MSNQEDNRLPAVVAAASVGRSAVSLTAGSMIWDTPDGAAESQPTGRAWLAEMPTLLPAVVRTWGERDRMLGTVLLAAGHFLNGLSPYRRHDPEALHEAVSRADPVSTSSFLRPHRCVVPLGQYLVDLLTAIARTFDEEGHSPEAEAATITADLCRGHLLAALTAELYRCASATSARYDTVNAVQTHQQLIAWLRQQTPLHPAASSLADILFSIPAPPPSLMGGRAATQVVVAAEPIIRHRAVTLRLADEPLRGSIMAPDNW
jgi:hypothetical protein